MTVAAVVMIDVMIEEIISEEMTEEIMEEETIVIIEEMIDVMIIDQDVVLVQEDITDVNSRFEKIEKNFKISKKMKKKVPFKLLFECHTLYLLQTLFGMFFTFDALIE